MNAEEEIRVKVAKIKANLEASGALDRKAFSTAVAQEMFNMGMRPTGGMVLGFTKMGSTQNVIQDVNEFWSELKGRLDTTMAVPAEFREVTSKLVVELWNMAQNKAGEEFETLKQEYETNLSSMFDELGVATDLNQDLRASVDSMKNELDERQSEIDRLAGLNEGLVSECTAWKENIENLNKLLEDERSARKSDSEAFMATLDKEREERGLAEARLKEEKNYAMMEIDKARQETKAITDFKDKKISELNDSVSVYRNQSNGLKDSNGRLSMELEHLKGVVEGMKSELLSASSRNQELIVLLNKFARPKNEIQLEHGVQPQETVVKQNDSHK